MADQRLKIRGIHPGSCGRFLVEVTKFKDGGVIQNPAEEPQLKVKSLSNHFVDGALRD